MKKNLLFTIFLGLILVLAACGGDDNTSTSEEVDDKDIEVVEEDTSEESKENSETDTAAASNEITVVGHNFGFDQDEYVVQSGEEVTLTYVNDEGHHGISIDEFDVHINGEGEATFVPDEPGEYLIYCNIMCGEGHGDMVTILIVL
ncbi:cupredoxin domain-containing protein [Oceanobacillus sp. CAU 1775]